MNARRTTPEDGLSDGERRLLAAFDGAVERFAEVACAHAGAHPWQERMRRALTAMLELAERKPGLARLLLVEAEAPGTPVAVRRKQLLESLAGAIEAGVQEAGLDAAASAEGAATAVGRRAAPCRPKDGPWLEGLEMESVLAAAAVLVWAHMRSQDRPLAELVDPLMAMLVLRHEGPEGSARQLCAEAAPGAAGLTA